MAVDALDTALAGLAPALVPTDEQAAIIAAARDDKRSLMVRAYAGTGKTTTLEMLAKALPPGPALALAFNVKIKQELEKRFPPHFTIKTMNGLGHSAWQATCGRRLTLDDKKLGKIITAIFCEARYDGPRDDWTIVRALASAAMARGLVPSVFSQRSLVPDTEDTWTELCEDVLGKADATLAGFARQAIIEDIKQGIAGTISFDDQIYLSTMFGGRFPRFPLVLVDEAQDLSPLNHLQVARCASDRLIVVGDARQAIYAFRGADTASIDKLRALRPEWIELPLATTFRCPKLIVERQREHVPEFRAASGNAQGAFLDWLPKECQAEHENEPLTWDHEKLFAFGLPSVAVLCRNNAPLLALAFKLLRRSCGVTMLGRDIGKSLVLLSKKILPNDSADASACAEAITQWRNNEVAKAKATDHEEKIEGIEDRAEALLAVLDGSGAANAATLRAKLADLFSRESGRIVLSTGHKAKGLEWDLVLHLDPWRLPSKHAKRAALRGDERPLEQEKNLQYVIATRTKHVLIYANLEDFA